MWDLLGTWIHNLDPFIFEINGFGPRWYGLAYIIGLVAGWYMVRRWAQLQRLPIQPEAVQDLAVYFGVGMIAGGRLGYCLFYDTSLLMPPWQILFVWQGGMASHGGIVGMFLGVLLYCRKHRIPFWVIADASATVTPIGICAGRVANFINGELWGRPTDVSWGMRFPTSIHTDMQVKLAEATAAAGDPELGSPAWNTLQHELVRIENQYTAAMVHLDKLDAGSDQWIQMVNEYVLVRHPSQLYAALLEGVVVFTIAMLAHRMHRKPGLSLGIVLSVYAVVRFINEFWRNPDEGYELFFGWMSKGQLLSIPILLIGLGFIIWAVRKQSMPELYQRPDKES